MWKPWKKVLHACSIPKKPLENPWKRDCFSGNFPLFFCPCPKWTEDEDTISLLKAVFPAHKGQNLSTKGVSKRVFPCFPQGVENPVRKSKLSLRKKKSDVIRDAIEYYANSVDSHKKSRILLAVEKTKEADKAIYKDVEGTLNDGL